MKVDLKSLEVDWTTIYIRVSGMPKVKTIHTPGSKRATPSSRRAWYADGVLPESSAFNRADSTGVPRS